MTGDVFYEAKTGYVHIALAMSRGDWKVLLDALADREDYSVGLLREAYRKAIEIVDSRVRFETEAS